MSQPSFSDFYKSLLELVKTFEEKNTILRVEEDLAVNIIRIFGERIDSVSLLLNIIHTGVYCITVHKFLNQY